MSKKMECLLRCLPSTELRAVREELSRAQEEVAQLQRKLSDDWQVVDAAHHAVARRYECKVCFAAPIEVVFLPCGHAFSCAACATRQCYFCKCDVEHTTRLHLL